MSDKDFFGWVAVCLSCGAIVHDETDKDSAEAAAKEHKKNLGCKFVVVGQKI